MQPLLVYTICTQTNEINLDVYDQIHNMIFCTMYNINNVQCTVHKTTNT